MKIDIVRKPPVEQPIEKIVLELTPEEARYIRWLAGWHAGHAAFAGDDAAERLYRKLEAVANVPLDGSKCFLD